MGISPEIWGPHAWAFLHLMILAEKEPLDKGRLIHYHTLYDTLTYLLPCDKCRIHLAENLKKVKPLEKIQNKDELFAWSVDLHNYVNQSHGKPVYDLNEMISYWKAIAKGERTLDNKVCHKNIYKWSFYVAILFIVILLFIITREHRKK